MQASPPLDRTPDAPYTGSSITFSQHAGAMAILTVIIPVFHKWALTADCLRSLAEFTPITDIHVIVADNASSDETPEACPALGRELFADNFTYLRFDENRNFGPACNAAAKLVATDLVFFLNNDTLLINNWLPPLLNALKADPLLAGVGPLLLYPDNTVQHLGIVIWPGGLNIGHLYSHIPAHHALAQKRRKLSAITGAALLLPTQSFRDAGGFYEGYINGFEDVDLCLQLTQNKRYMSVIPESRVIHLESQTQGRHAGENNNSDVLCARWDLARYSNMARLAKDDGYSIKVDANLQVYFAPPLMRQRELLKDLRALHTSGEPTVRFWERLLDEPFWEQGYELFADMLLKSNDAETAALVYSRSLQFIPTMRNYEHLLVLEPRLKNLTGNFFTPIFEDARQNFLKYCSFILQENRYRTYLDKLTARIAENGGGELIEMYVQAGLQADRLRAQWQKNTP